MHILSKVYEKITAWPLFQDYEVKGFLSKCQITYFKGLGTFDALITIMHDIQHALDSESQAHLVQLEWVQLLIVLIMIDFL